MSEQGLYRHVMTPGLFEEERARRRTASGCSGDRAYALSRCLMDRALRASRRSLLDAMFNVWRYGSLGNAVYDNPIFRTPGLWLKLKAFAALWVSPGGGALVYWFLGAVLVIAVPLLAVLSRDRRRRAAGSLLLLGIAAQTALLSAWWSPFGWYAWGPRLLLPTLAMGLVAVVAVFQHELSLVSRMLRKHVWGLAAVAALSLLSAAANLGFLADPGATLAWFYTPHTSACHRFPDFMTERAHYYDCVHGLMTWRPIGSLWTTGLSHVWSGGGLVLMGCVGVALSACLDFSRPSLVESEEPRAR